MSEIRNVCVYCASSQKCRPSFFDAASALGRSLAEAGLTVVYGGGAVGLMGALADSALEAGGKVVGVIPHFMNELEWQHEHVSELRVVDNMHERKRHMIELADAFVALPGGCGTLEEVLEAITWMRLGLHRAPIVIVNVDQFYDPLLQQLQLCVEERTMGPHHAEMWSEVQQAADVIPEIQRTPPWGDDARRTARV